MKHLVTLLLDFYLVLLISEATALAKKIAADAAADSFTLTHTLDGHIEVLKAVASAMKKPGGFVVIQDDEGTAFSTDGSAIANVGFSDIDYAPIASTGTAVTVDGTGVVVATL